MKKITFLIFSLLSLELTTSVGCSRAGYAQNVVEKPHQRISNSAELPPLETIEEENRTIRFGDINLGGLNCNIAAGETALIERDSIQLPAFETFVELTEGTSLKRSSCNLSMTFEAVENTGFAVTSIELDHEYSIKDSAVFRLGGEVFVAGTKGSKFEEMTVITKQENNLMTEHKRFELAEPLIVCGKTGGLLRMNLNQILEQADSLTSGVSHLRALKINYAPVDCQ